jgi:hypothetical protein
MPAYEAVIDIVVLTAIAGTVYLKVANAVFTSARFPTKEIVEAAVFNALWYPIGRVKFVVVVIAKVPVGTLAMI